MSTPLVSVIVVHYNTPTLTLACVESVFTKTHTTQVEVIVVDNASTVGNIDALHQQSSVKLIRSERNLGFAGGNNLGIANSTGQYVLLLNSDCELDNSAIDIAVAYYQQNELWLGALSSALAYPDGRPQYPTGRFPSLKNQLIELLRQTKNKNEKWMERFYLGDRLPATKAAPVDWVWGAFFLVSRQKLSALSGSPLPDTFFLYYEDVQWCYELAQHGWQNYYYPSAKVIHHLSGSGSGGSEEDKYWQKIQPNEKRFLQIYKGTLYTFCYYTVKALFHISLRTGAERAKGKRYWRVALGSL